MHRDPTPRSRIAIAGIVAACAAMVVALAAIPHGAFYSGDGGLKYLAARQFAQGILAVDLRLPAEPWVEALWAQGTYPFEPPFVYQQAGRHLPAFPPWFALLTAPFLALFGWWGLFLIPAASVAWTAAEVETYLRRRVGRGPRLLALAALLLGTPFLLYGAMFWEHTLACALSTAGLVRLARACDEGRPRPFVPGFVLGLAGWLRPEHFVLAAIALVVLRPVLHRADEGEGPAKGLLRLGRWDAAVLGLVAATGAWALTNFALFGSPAGVHGLQVTGIEGPGRWWMIRTVATSLVPALFLYAPVMIVVGALAFAAVHPAVHRRLPVASAFAALAILFPLAACLVVPNDGGKQWGPRYLLGAMPPGALAIALLLDQATGLPLRPRHALQAAAIAALLAGIAVNAGAGSARLVQDYAGRTTPVLDLVRTGSGPVVVDLGWTALEVVEAAGGRPLFRLRGADQLPCLLEALRTHRIPSFQFVAMKVGDVDVRTAPMLDGRAGLACRSLGESDALVVWTCEDTPGGPEAVGR